MNEHLLNRSMTTLHNINASSVDVYSVAAAKVKPQLPPRPLNPRRVRALAPPPRRALLWRRDASSTRLCALVTSGAVTMSNKTLSTPSVTGVMTSTGRIACQGLGVNNSLSLTTPTALTLYGTTTNFSVYLGSNKTPSSTTAPYYGNVTTYAVRFRCYDRGTPTNGAAHDGFIFENSADQALMALGDQGDIRVKGTITGDGALVARTVCGTHIGRLRNAAVAAPTRNPTRHLKNLDQRAAVLESGRLVSNMSFSSNVFGGAALSVTPATATSGAGLSLTTFDATLATTTALTMQGGVVDVNLYLTTPGLAVNGDDVAAHLTTIDNHLVGLDAATAASGLIDALQSAYAAGSSMGGLIPKVTAVPGGLPDGFITPDEFTSYLDADEMMVKWGDDVMNYSPQGTFANAAGASVNRAASSFSVNANFNASGYTSLGADIMPTSLLRGIDTTAANPVVLEVGNSIAMYYDGGIQATTLQAAEVCAAKVNGARYIRAPVLVAPRVGSLPQLARRMNRRKHALAPARPRARAYTVPRSMTQVKDVGGVVQSQRWVARAVAHAHRHRTPLLPPGRAVTNITNTTATTTSTSTPALLRPVMAASSLTRAIARRVASMLANLAVSGQVATPTLCVNPNAGVGNYYGISYTGAAPNAFYATYLAVSGAGASWTGGTAVAGYDTLTNNALRNRCNTSSARGFVWENAAEALLASLNGSTGLFFAQSLVSGAGAAITGAVTAASAAITGAVTAASAAVTGAVTAGSVYFGATAGAVGTAANAKLRLFAASATTPSLNDYTIGVASSTLTYNSNSKHQWLTAGAETMSLSGVGNLAVAGTVTAANLTTKQFLYVGRDWPDTAYVWTQASPSSGGAIYNIRIASTCSFTATTAFARVSVNGFVSLGGSGSVKVINTLGLNSAGTGFRAPVWGSSTSGYVQVCGIASSEDAGHFVADALYAVTAGTTYYPAFKISSYTTSTFIAHATIVQVEHLTSI